MSAVVKLMKPAKNSRGWYVGVYGNWALYLHTDGVIRETVQPVGSHSGYFATESEAMVAKKRWESANKTPAG